VRGEIHLHTRGDGPAVLWVHGYTMDSTCWEQLWGRLPGWRHIGVDLPGHGRSGPMPRGWTLADLAGQVAEVARAEQAPRLVALSFGSCVALQLAIDEPGLLRRLVVGAPTIAGAPDQPEAAQRYKELLLLRRMGSGGDVIAEQWMRSPPDIFRGTERHPELRARLRATIGRHRWDELDSGAMRSINACVHTDEQLGRIAAETLVVAGAEDMPTFVRNAERLRRTVPRVSVLRLAAAGHLCLIERPDAVAGAVAAHLN
jgi:pimeloyl-ACP methyl ester carboxylesterase